MVLGGRDADIGRGWVFLTPRGRYRARALGNAWPLELEGGDSRGPMSVSPDILFKADMQRSRAGAGISHPKHGYPAHALDITLVCVKLAVGMY